MNMDVEDFAAAFVRFENGASLILEVSWLLHHDVGEGAEDRQLWLYGTKGGPSCRNVRSTKPTTRPNSTTRERCRSPTAKMRAHALECVEFARAVATGGPSPVPAEQSLQVTGILDGIYRSQEKGREVRLSL
jgi:predicted dehydrogenase